MVHHGSSPRSSVRFMIGIGILDFLFFHLQLSFPLAATERVTPVPDANVSDGDNDGVWIDRHNVAGPIAVRNQP